MDQYCNSALHLGHFLHKTLALFSILYERKRQTNCTQHVLTELGICRIQLLLAGTSVVLSYSTLVVLLQLLRPI